MEELASHYVMAFGLTALLAVVCVAIHYEALRAISAFHPKRWHGRVGVGGIIMCLIVAHCIEALVFGLGYWVGSEVLYLGTFIGPAHMNPFVYAYFSLETFTTQSLGNVYPTGPLRLTAAVEPLVGLILIGWSTSFTFLAMQRNWPRWKSDEKD